MEEEIIRKKGANNSIEEGNLSRHISGVIGFIANGVKNDLKARKNLDLILSVYNMMMDEEKDGANYIFNIHNKKDVKFLVASDLMTATDIAFVVNNPNVIPDGLFFMNNGGESLEAVKDLVSYLSDWVVAMTKCVLLYVARGKDENSPYKVFYEKYFFDRVWQMDIFYNIF
jgi:hypothetical protein